MVVDFAFVRSSSIILLTFISAKLEGEHFFTEIPGLCETIAKLCTVSCVTSLLTIATMSLNRYTFVCHNILYRKIFSRRNSIIICIAVYCVGLALVLLNLAGIGDHRFDKRSLECIWDRMATYPYTVVYSVTLVWVPCIVIGICYLRLYFFVHENKKKLLNHKTRSLAGSPRSLIPPKSTLKLAKTFILIYVVFVTCWAPYALLIIIDYNDVFAHEIHVYLTVWAHLHPSVNWLIYYLTQRKLAEAYRQILVCTLYVKKPNRLDTKSSTENRNDERASGNNTGCNLPKMVLQKSNCGMSATVGLSNSVLPIESAQWQWERRANKPDVYLKGKFKSAYSDGDIKRYMRPNVKKRTSYSTVDFLDPVVMTTEKDSDEQSVYILLELYKSIRGLQSVVTSHVSRSKGSCKNGETVLLDTGTDVLVGCVEA